MNSISLACSLEGRDLAVVKSLLNIRNEYQGISFKFTENLRQCDVIITKEYLDEGAIYYGINKVTDLKIPILPNLNPKSIQQFFNTFADEIEVKTDDNKIDNLNSFVNVLLNFNQSNAENILVFQTLDNTIIISRQDNMVYSLHDDVTELYKAIGLNDWQQIDVRDEVNLGEFKLAEPLEAFCWNLGLEVEDKLIGNINDSKPLSYKLISWPNFGELSFNKDFIYLSSLIWKKSETFEALLETSQVEETVIKKFLNATLLTGHVVTLKNEPQKQSVNMTRTSGFLTGLKKVFGFG